MSDQDESTRWEKPTIEKLLIRPQRKVEEIELAYSLRLSELNGLIRPIRFDDGSQNRGHGYMRICPLCMQGDSPYWHQSWNDFERPWCDVHGIWLSDTCSSCGRRISWNSARLSFCRCGHAWRDSPVKAIDSTLLNSLRTNDPPLGVLKFFGAIEVFGLSARPMKRASGESLVLATKLIEKGGSIAKEWAADFTAVLNRWRVTPESPYVLQLFRSAFPGLLRSLRSIKHQPWQERFFRCLDNYVVSTRSTCFPIVGRHKFLTAIATQKTVATELGIRSERLGKLLLQSQASTTASRSTAMGRSRKYVDPTAVKQVADYLADRISITQAASHLGISSARVAKLISSKVLLRRNNWLSRDDVDRFKSTLSHLSLVSFVVGAQSVTLGFALRNWVPVLATADFLQAIIEKRILISVPQSPSNISAWLVDGNTVRLWRDSLRQDIREFHSIPEAAIQLGYKQEVVYDLVNCGLLRTSMQMLRKRTARCISQKELKRFQTAYVPLSTLAQKQRVLAKQSLEWARSKGMKLATGPLIDGSRQYFVKAASVSPHLLH